MTPPKCPYCGEEAQWAYGDARNIWITIHLNSRSHRIWCFLVARFARLALLMTKIGFKIYWNLIGRWRGV